MSRSLLGRQGEDVACAYLRSKGHRILERNFRNKLGEIDLITREGGTLCFVEVKTREVLSCGQPFESVHWRKQRQMARVAMSYLGRSKGLQEPPARFDVVSVTLEHGEWGVEHIPNAFDLNDCGYI